MQAPFWSGASSIYSIPGPPNSRVRSVINYDYLMQFTDKIRQQTARASWQSEYSKLQSIIADLNTTRPVLLTLCRSMRRSPSTPT